MKRSRHLRCLRRPSLICCEQICTNFRKLSLGIGPSSTCKLPLETYYVHTINHPTRVDIDILIQEAKATTWRGRAQLWNFQKNQSGPSHNRNNSIASNRDQRLSGVQSRASRTSSSIPTSHSSVMSFQTRTSQLTAVTSVLASENSSNINIDARTFELPKQPLLVLFLRARRQRTREVGQLTLIKIPSKIDRNLNS